MIRLYSASSGDGEILITLCPQTRQVAYFKDGELQTLMDAQGRNLAPHIDAAVDLLRQNKTGRVLVLGHAGGAAASLLHRAGMDVVAVDRDPRAKGLARLFFRAPPCLEVVTSEAAKYVADAPAAAFDAVLADIQDCAIVPPSYLSSAFWSQAVRLLRPGGLVLVDVIETFHGGPAWPRFQETLAGAGLNIAFLSEPSEWGNRLLAVSRASCGADASSKAV